jgi:hypothetical protein
MNLSIWRSSIVVFIVVLLSFVLLKSGYSASAEPLPNTTQQATATTERVAAGSLYISSQGTEVKSMPASSEPLDESALKGLADKKSASEFSTTASFYHIPGSVLQPVDSSTTLKYDSMGCVHAGTGGYDLLNAPLDIPNGSRIVLLRLYYDDTSDSSNVSGWITRYNSAGTDYEDLVSVSSTGSSGHGSAYGDLDHTVDAYNWSYILVARTNGASSAQQVCGLRVMYYAPALKKSTVVIPLF